MQHIKKHYPNAITISELEHRIKAELEQNNFTLTRTIWGTSICSDEVNNTFNTLSSLFAGPGPFRFGGISGMPFTGRTGMMAFDSHIPDDGNAFILYGPHIGVSEEGVTGEINREAQKSNTTCCGSLIAGLGQLQNDAVPSEIDLIDQQQFRVSSILNGKKDKILSAEDSIKEVTEVAYDQIKDDVFKIVESTREALNGRKIYMMGGIVINTDWDKEDCFEVRDSELITF